MGVILQAAYRRSVYVNGRAALISVPCPADRGTPDVDWWYDHLAHQANEFAKIGFTAILLPPLCKTISGAQPGADGYGIYDDYDIGNKNQCNSIPTRFGNREQLQRLCAILRANEIDIYADMVPHQRQGGNNGNYNYLNAAGQMGGRFPKHPACFFGPESQGRVPRDPIAGPASDDFSFGDELCTVRSKPEGYVLNGLINAGDWLTQTLDLQGYRVDDTKGQVSHSVLQWSNSKSMAGKIVIGEYDDGNRNNLNWWVWESGIMGRAYAFDFSLHYELENMCNNPYNYNMGQLDHSGYAGLSPTTAVTFVENPDTDTDGFATIIWNKMLAYAYILTSEGYPVVYYRDYSTDRNCYGLKPGIDNLIWIHENLAFGETINRWKDFQFIVYERTGDPKLLVGLNKDMNSNWKTVTVDTGFGPNVQLHDYTGHGEDKWTDWQGRVTISIPPNNDGLGYICYSRAGLSRERKIQSKTTKQIFFGDKDLDIDCANTMMRTVGRIWCAADTDIVIGANNDFQYQVIGPGESHIENKLGKYRTTKTGWHEIQIQSKTGIKAFHLQVLYQAPLTL